MPEAGDEDAASSIEALLEENAVLRAENEALQDEAQRFGIDVEKSASSRPDLVQMQERLDALKNEREALLGVLRLGSEVEEMQATNENLKKEAKLLQQENAALKDRNKMLRLSHGRPEELQETPEYVEGPHGPVSPEVAGVSRSDMDAIKGCNPEQRKEIIASLLKAGFFDAIPKEDEAEEEREVADAANPQAGSSTQGGGLVLPPPARRPGADGATLPPAAWHGTRGPGSMSEVLERRASEIADALRAGNGKMLGSFNHKQRKELATEMLQLGLVVESPTSRSPGR